MLNFDRDQLEDRRRACDEGLNDVLVWSNERVMKWAESVGLKVRKFHQILNYFEFSDEKILLAVFFTGEIKSI